MLGGLTETVEWFGDPWRVLESLLRRYELPQDLDVPFPLGGCFGYWGYDLRNFVEPKLPRTARHDLGLPDCQVGFYPALVVFDHLLEVCHIVATGLEADGSRHPMQAQKQLSFWLAALQLPLPNVSTLPLAPARDPEGPVLSSMGRERFLTAVERAKDYIHAGDIYQVNLAHRLETAWGRPAWTLFQELSVISPAPFAAFLEGEDFSLASSSPEQFLRISGRHAQTRPIKGTRPRANDPTRDAQLSYELQTSPKELAELVMITDLLRNDLGKVCEYGSVQTPELARLERYPQVQHLVSTVEGRLRPDVSHVAALASCFPGGSITGAPKYRAMEIIDELEPVSRGPYTGALGYLGFNHESQFSILIRTAICHRGRAYFHVGAGIVADSDPEAEYLETLAKARGFLDCVGAPPAEFPAEVPSFIPASEWVEGGA
jgi:para-aminobenzoate synthetase component 1